MRQNYTKKYLWVLLVLAVASMNFTFAFSISKKDTTYKIRPANKNSYLKNGLHLSMPPLKPAATSTLKVTVSHPDDKLLNNVLVFPNPITDQINLKYSVSRNAVVSIKVMDLLGNEVITLFNQRVDTGEQSLTYNLNNKLTSGFYFVRVVAGTESVIRRISVL